LIPERAAPHRAAAATTMRMPWRRGTWEAKYRTLKQRKSRFFFVLRVYPRGQKGIRCGRVTELMRDAVGCGASIEAEIFRAAYGDPKGQKYWETHFSEVVPIVSLADLLSVHLAVSGENIEDENMEEMQLSIVSALYYAINSLEILRPLGCDSGSIDPTVAARWLLSKPKREYFVPESLRQHLRSNQPRTIKHAKAMQARASLSHRKRGRKPRRKCFDGMPQ
jgi:hypothetical protein